jgi:hypothetical protein
MARWFLAGLGASATPEQRSRAIISKALTLIRSNGYIEEARHAC